MSHYQVGERIYRRDPHVHGSAQWASLEHLRARGFGDNNPVFLGYLPAQHKKTRAHAITTKTSRHAIILGPTRSGKGICSIIPECLSHKGSLFVLDNKGGENARVAALTRRDDLGHALHVLDAWDHVCSDLGLSASCFNVIDWLNPDDDEFVDNAFIIADALVVSENTREPFWSEEAKSLIAGLCMHVKTMPKVLLPMPSKNRTLGQVRALLNLGPQAFQHLIAGEFEKADDESITLIKPGMAQSRNQYVRASAGRIMSKSPKERSGVLSTAQSNTHFLESPAVQRILSRSDFNPKDLENGKTSIFVVMPQDKLLSQARFMRLMVTIHLITASRFKTKQNPPALFMLEEADSLGTLPAVPMGYSQLAGQGVIIKTVWQDFNQMSARYDKWQTMLANSGYIQCLGTFDHFTAEYLSKMCGATTIEHLSQTSAALRAGLVSDPMYLSRDDILHGRALITPDEIMSMHPCAQLLLFPHTRPVTAYKTAYFLDRRYRNQKGRPIYSIHPHYADKPTAKPVNFMRRGLDIGAQLHNILDGS